MGGGNSVIAATLFTERPPNSETEPPRGQETIAKADLQMGQLIILSALSAAVDVTPTDKYDHFK